MIKAFQGPFSYDQKIISDWNSSDIGVYYCGLLAPTGSLAVHYVGRAIGDGGIRNRLLQHLGESKWVDLTHFGFHACDTYAEAIEWEEKEIALYKPRYNTVGKY